MLDLYETIQVRHGLMLVGETWSGKSSILHILSSSLRKVNKCVYQSTLNPKSV